MRANQTLSRLLSSRLSEVHSVRQRAVFAAVSGLLSGGRLGLTPIGRSLAGPVAPRHGIKRIDRLLGNPKLHSELPVFWRALIRLVLRSVRRPLIAVDWTEVGRKQFALVAAIPVDGRALPIYWRVHPISKLNAPSPEREFLAELSQLLPKGCKPIHHHRCWIQSRLVSESALAWMGLRRPLDPATPSAPRARQSLDSRRYAVCEGRARQSTRAWNLPDHSHPSLSRSARLVQIATKKTQRKSTCHSKMDPSLLSRVAKSSQPRAPSVGHCLVSRKCKCGENRKTLPKSNVYRRVLPRHEKSSLRMVI